MGRACVVFSQSTFLYWVFWPCWPLRWIEAKD